MKARLSALIITAGVAVYLFLAGVRGIELVRTGDSIAVILGLAVLALPVIGGALAIRELKFGLDSQRLGQRLAREGGLPVDDVARRPSGRAIRAAADERAAQRIQEVELAPSWQAWFRLAVAYDDAGDRRRARGAMREAILMAKRSAKSEG